MRAVALNAIAHDGWKRWIQWNTIDGVFAINLRERSVDDHYLTVWESPHGAVYGEPGTVQP
jgi:hypothetical protein